MTVSKSGGGDEKNGEYERLAILGAPGYVVQPKERH